MASMTDKDYYQVLGVDTTATTDEIRKAFQAKARTLHPDVNKDPDAEERFKEVSEAYAVLSDDAKRQRYDAMRAGGLFGTGSGSGSSPYGSPPPPGSSPGGSPFGGGPFGGYPFGGGPFGTGPFLFGGTRRRTAAPAYNPKAGDDVIYELTMNREEAAAGGKRTISYQHYASCDVCHGSGSEDGVASRACPTCGGSGHITIDLGEVLGGFGLGFGTMVMGCPECEGTGRVVSDPCRACHGSGRVLTTSTLELTIPQGVHDGNEVRLTAQGNAGTNGEAGGDFVCRIAVPEERLSRKTALGFSSLGLALIIFVVGVVVMGITPLLISVGLVSLVPALYGAYNIFSEGILHRPKIWWKRGFQTLVAGVSEGLIIALFLVLFMSCTSISPRSGFRQL